MCQGTIPIQGTAALPVSALTAATYWFIRRVATFARVVDILNADDGYCVSEVVVEWMLLKTVIRLPLSR